MITELRHTFRTAWRHPFTNAVGVLSLAFGVGISAALFTVIAETLLSPLSFERRGEVVSVHQQNPKLDGANAFSSANFLDLQDATHAFAKLAAFGTADETLLGQGTPRRVRVAIVGPAFFDVFGVRALRGRELGEQDAHARSMQGVVEGRGYTIVLSHKLWQERFAADTNVIGRSVRIDDREYEIVGVMPAEMTFPPRSDAWVPLAFGDVAPMDRGGMNLGVVGTLRGGLSHRDAQAELNTIARGMWRAVPFNEGMSFPLLPLKEVLFGDYARTLWILFALSALLVLMIGANVGILSISRALFRQREIAIRLAVGATTRRIVEQLVSEAALIALAASLLAFGLTQAFLRGFARLLPAQLSEVETVHLSTWSIAFLAAVACVLSVMLAVGPVAQLLRANAIDGLAEGGFGRTMRPSSMVAIDGLVVVQSAIASVLLGSTLLLSSSYLRSLSVGLGIDARNVMTAEMMLPTRHADGDVSTQAVSDILRRIHSLPNVTAAASSLRLPVVDPGGGAWFQMSGASKRATYGEKWRPEATYQVVTPEFFDVFRIPIIRGRGIALDDQSGSQPIVVVSERFAKKYIPNADPLGQTLVLTPWPGVQRTIVGVVADTKQDGVTGPADAAIYVPLAQLPAARINLVVRTSDNEPRIAEAITRQVWTVDPDLSFGSIAPMAARVSETLRPLRLSAMLVAVFGVAAVALSALGVFGVTSLVLTQRIPEIGIRVALGATRTDVAQSLFGRTLALCLIGVVIGSGLTVLVGRLASGLLYATKATDPAVLGLTATLVVGIAATSTLPPLLRAIRLDPARILRGSN